MLLKSPARRRHAQDGRQAAENRGDRRDASDWGSRNQVQHRAQNVRGSNVWNDEWLVTLENEDELGVKIEGDE